MNKYFRLPSQSKNRHARPDRSEYRSFDHVVSSTESNSCYSSDDGVAFVFHNEGDDADTFHLRGRSSTGVSGGEATAAKQTFIEKKVCLDDSLTSIALRYGCTVAELKRANNILTDQEIHGLKTIKVPVKPYSLLIEEIKDDNAETTSSDDGQKDEVLSSNVRTLSIGSSIFPNDSVSFLSAMDEDLERIRLTTSLYKSSLEEVTEELTCKRFHPLNRECKPPERSRHFGRFVIIWIIVITIVIPLIILLRLMPHELQKNSTSST